MKPVDPLFLIVDLFCGFGGTTTGFEDAELLSSKICKVIACVNHDPKAIKSHWLNYPDVKHFEEDIRTLNLTGLIEVVDFWRKKYPNAKLILHASLECTNFSKANGGRPRKEDSRTLANHLFRYQKAINPDYITIENVVEFMSWGPLDANGKPISRKNGESWMKWKKKICKLGYYDDWKQLNSADFGGYTSRNRLFGCFAKKGLPICWPETTHTKRVVRKSVSQQKLFEEQQLKPFWKPVKDVLNFKDEGKSILNRKKPLKDKTLKRIYDGLIKYIANGDTSFLSKYYSGASKNISVNQPTGTLTTIDHHALVQADFLASYYGTGKNIISTDHPCPTISTKDRIALIQAGFFLDKHFGKNSQNQSIHQPAGSILPNDKHRLVEAKSFILNPSHGGYCTSTEAPSPVIIARQDKAPLYLVHAEGGDVALEVYEDDSEIMVMIKQFMSAYGLVDIKMRMLRVKELLVIQGFPENYKMVGNQTDHKKFIGNSVHPLVPKSWMEALGAKILDEYKLAA